MFSYLLDEHSELRLLLPHYAEALFALTDANRKHLRRWLPWVDDNSTFEDTKAYIQGALDGLARGEQLPLTVWHRGKLAGTLTLFNIVLPHRTAEIGYWLGAAFEGKGLMTRGVEALINYAFFEMGLGRLEIRAHTKNLRSRAIPERLGFMLEGILRQEVWLHGKPQDMALYALLKQDWPKQKPRSKRG
ncbi:GNAT family N-acetyltransferase [Meiothermus sp.]|uniref:GNAT family N-acetyltransferase n=1 Tax=Meiothermus sp. TaxID=1955249 RepID=UPI0021DD0297|nr:GNAT family protein [Meiothermus sp.]GIW35010.1 MAG: ribosomal-protein-serine acetyltransferase [Meiothermus sp.]